MKLSTVSPLRWETMAPQPARRAISIAATVSVSVPIWLSLIRTALATFSRMPRAMRSTLVTNRSSPTSSIFSPELAVEDLPARPVVLGQAVLEDRDRIVLHPVRVHRDHLLGGDLASLGAQVVAALLEEAARRRVEGYHDVLAGPVAGLASMAFRITSTASSFSLERRREAALVADGGRVAGLLQHGLERVVDLAAPAQGLAEVRRRRPARS